VFNSGLKRANWKKESVLVKRTIWALALILSFLFSGCVGTLFVNLALADVIGPTAPEPPASIYIMNDGSIVGTDNIKRNGNVYALIGNISGTVVVRRDGIVLDGAGYTLQGDGNRAPVIAGAEIYSTGIFLQSRVNVVIKDLAISNFSRGIELSLYMMYNPGCQNITICGNTITNSEIGIRCANSENNVFSRNTLENNTYGISFSVSDNNVVSENTIVGNDYGVELYYSLNNNIYRNNFVNNTWQAVINREWGMSSAGRWDNGSLGNYWSNYGGDDDNSDGIGDTPYIIDADNTDRYPLMAPWGAPAVFVVNPENKTYASSIVSLAFTVNKPAAWVGYSLDGQKTVTINGNTTIAGLTNGLHNVTVYAKDTFGNVGASETVSFSVAEPFPTTLVIAPIASVVVVGVGLLVYFRKRRK
jgi:parallel beta-helix repeat protein